MQIKWLYLFMIFCSASRFLAQPNVILILTDDQGWGDLSINGNKNISTPNIDKLGSEGIVFDRFYVQPVCSPTRAEILTGRYHLRSGVFSTSKGGERMNANEVTIAQILKENGYATAIYGKWHNGMQAPYHPNTKGFDDFYGFASGHWGNYFDPMLEHNGKIVNGNAYLPDDLTDHALDFIDQHESDPFFLYLPYNTPHSPMQVPSEYWEQFKNQPLAMKNRHAESEDTLFTKAALAMVKNIDDNVGRITAKINELQLEEKTIIIFLSDNGPNGSRWNGGMKGKKGSTDEGGVRVPMIIKWSENLLGGSVIKNIAGGIDILPTILDLAGIKHNFEKPLDGRSLKNDLYDLPVEERYLFQYWKGNTSVRSQQFRLDHENRLFHMIHDPGQYYDVSSDYPMVYDSILKVKAQWVKNVASLLNENDERPITIAFPGYNYYQIPARDAQFTGNIERSNRYPNCTFLTNWSTPEDEIFWDVEVLESGTFGVEIYYTCSEKDVGSTFELSCGASRIRSIITDAHDPPLKGAENDVYPRMEGYVKDFKAKSIGSISLKKGKHRLRLKALNIPNQNVMDFRLLMFTRI